MNTLDSPDSAQARRAWLSSILLRSPDTFAARLAAGLARWRSLGRGARRRVTRRAALTAAGAALALALVGGPLLATPARAATITVDETTCTLVNAIRSANTDAAVGGCAAGAPGADTIELAADVVLTAPAGNYYGDTGLALVTSAITIEGNGHTVSRDAAAPRFRILSVGASGDLTLNDVTISGGLAGSFDRGGGFYLKGGTLAINASVISGNEARLAGGAMNRGGVLFITDSVVGDNYASSSNGGGLYIDGGTTTVTGSLFDDNEASNDGGGLFVKTGAVTIIDSTISGGSAEEGPGVVVAESGATVTISGSTITDNGNTNTGGGLMVGGGVADIVNSTISGNRVLGSGGGIANYGGRVSLTNVTVTGNYSRNSGGSGIAQQYSPDTEMTITRSIVSGNTSRPGGPEIQITAGTIAVDGHNVFSHAGQTSAQGFSGFTPGASDINASSDGATPTALAAILDPTLAANGGPTLTHNLVDGSPAVDLAPDADCAAAPTNGVDQRGFVRPLDAIGQGDDTIRTCDAGAVEFVADPGVFLSATAPGVTDDGVAFGPEDILRWKDGDWSLFFDGSAAGLIPTGLWRHKINAFHVDGHDVIMSFAQNARFVPGIPGKVDGMDLVRWNGSAFALWFDGQDVGLTNKTQEKIDALHVLDGSVAPPALAAAAGGSCDAYLLISTQGPGRVPNYDGTVLKFGGEDVLGFCLTQSGDDTRGRWIMVLDGSAEGMPRNSTDGLSAADGQTLYITTRGTFNVDAAAGGHSMVYEYDFGTGQFSGPVFSAPAEGLPRKVTGLQY